MKQFKRGISLMVLAAVLGAGPVAAQSLRNNSGPAEYPPESYQGKQYVDSKGCVYIRAGVDGATTWVPRVARNRTVVCGFQPTGIASAAEAPPARRANVPVISAAAPEDGAPAAEAPRQVRTAAAAPAPRPTPSARVPQTRQVRNTTPAPQRRVIQPAEPTGAGPAQTARIVTSQVVRGIASPTPDVAPRAVRPSAAPRAAVQVGGNCAGMSALSQQYMIGDDVRCGPQAVYSPYGNSAPAPMTAPAPRIAAPGYAPRTYGAPSVPSYDGDTPVRVIAAAPTNTRRVFEVPRTEVRRVVPGVRTSQQAVSPQARVVPRHVYEERALSREGVSVPEGYKPLWEDDRLNPRRAEQTLAGKRKMEMVWTQTVPRRLVPVEVAPVQRQHVVKKGHFSSRNAPAPAPVAAARYVKVGVRDSQSARRVAQNMANSGLRVRVGGNTVIAGPFASDADLAHAMAAARRSGYQGRVTR